MCLQGDVHLVVCCCFMFILGVNQRILRHKNQLFVLCHWYLYGAFGFAEQYDCSINLFPCFSFVFCCHSFLLIIGGYIIWPAFTLAKI